MFYKQSVYISLKRNKTDQKSQKQNVHTLNRQVKMEHNKFEKEK